MANGNYSVLVRVKRRALDPPHLAPKKDVRLAVVTRWQSGDVNDDGDRRPHFQSLPEAEVETARADVVDDGHTLELTAVGVDAADGAREGVRDAPLPTPLRLEPMFSPLIRQSAFMLWAGFPKDCANFP